MNDLSPNSKIARECFKEACLGISSLSDILEQKGFSPQAIQEITAKSLVSRMCRGCAKPLTNDSFAIWNTYWQACWAPSHPECRESGMKQEAYDCQCLDAGCNDCRHFERRTTFEMPRMKGSIGLCTKFNKEMTTVPNWAELHPCFEHRRAPLTIPAVTQH